MEYRDVHEFKKIYKYLTEEKGRPQSSIIQESTLAPTTINSIMKSTVDDPPRITTSTLVKIQDFNGKYKDLIYSTIMSKQEFEEFAHEVSKEYNPDYYGRRKPPTLVEENAAKLKTLDQCDVFDLLRALSLQPGINLKIDFTVGSLPTDSKE
jgi:hypothetical protein